jgi:hypothetical protein
VREAGQIKAKTKVQQVKIVNKTPKSTAVPVRRVNLKDAHDNAPSVSYGPARNTLAVTRVRRTTLPAGQSSIHVLRFALEERGPGLDDPGGSRPHEATIRAEPKVHAMPPFEVRLRPKPQRLRVSKQSTKSEPQPSLLRRLQYQMDLLEMSEALQ